LKRRCAKLIAKVAKSSQTV